VERLEAVGECGKSEILGVGRWFRGTALCELRFFASQAVLAIQWLWSLRRLWVAVTKRHSDCAAALPLRMNRSIRRLCLICP
jgi:hypothetical protein